MLPSGAGALSRSEMGQYLTRALRAWRGITLRQWAWTTAIALALLVGNAVGLLPPLLNAVPTVIGTQPPAWDIEKSVGATLIFLAAAYCLLLAISIVEQGAAHRVPPVRRYIVAGLAACGTGILIEASLYALVPGFAPQPGTLPLLQDTQRLLGRALWSVANFGLCGGLALAVYVRFRSARNAREAFNAAELERVAASREVLASRLTEMQARVEPKFLLGTLAQVEVLYERDPVTGNDMLDGLIAYLRNALPQLRTRQSTLQAEVQLAKSYLRIMQIRMGSRLACRVEVRPELAACEFPPMVLLPLIEEALRCGLEPMPHGGTLTISAEAGGDRLRVHIADDGLPRMTVANDGSVTDALHDRLRGLYGASARLELAANAPHGVIATIEVPLGTERHHR